MQKFEGHGFSAEIEWDKDQRPVIYVVGRGRVPTPKPVIDVIQAAVDMIDAGPFNHVCSVYNMLEVTNMPFMGRFINSGKMASSPRTKHIIIATDLPTMKLVASLMAVVGSSRLRTMDVCSSAEEIEAAIKSWLSLPERTLQHEIDKRRSL